MINSDLKARQLSVFLENRAGCLAEVIHLLAAAGINLRAISLADTSDFGILRFVADDPDKAEDALRQEGLNIGHTSVVAVEMPDRPGALDAILASLASQDVNVEYMYSLVPRSAAQCVLIFRFDKMDRAIDLLLAARARVIPAMEIRNL